MNKTTPKTETTAAAPRFSFVSQYLRDLSFECFAVPYEPREGKTDLGLEIGVSVQPLGKDDMHNVTLKLRAKAMLEDTTPIYIAELEYVGVFYCRDIPAKEMGPLLGIEAPALLFPFARAVLMQAIQNGGFQTPMIEPVNFAAIYIHAKQKNGKMAAEMHEMAANS